MVCGNHEVVSPSKYARIAWRLCCLAWACSNCRRTLGCFWETKRTQPSATAGAMRLASWVYE